MDRMEFLRRNGAGKGPPLFVGNASGVGRAYPSGSGVGIQYGGDRDVYAAAGYKPQLTHADMLSAEAREHIAGRIIDIFPEYTWRNPPILVDGPDPNGDRDSEFSQAWREVWESGVMLNNGDTQVGLDWAVPELDRVAGLGRWACLYIGTTGDKRPEDPIDPGEFSGPEDFAYSTIFGESAASVSAWDTDPSSPRYGRPKYYNLKTRRGGQATDIGSVHWTRVIHLALNGVGDLVEGRSHLNRVFNLLQDTLKVAAGTGEGGYRNADPGVIVTTQANYEAPEDGDIWGGLSDDSDDTEEVDLHEEARQAVRSYLDGLERFLMTEGYDVEVLTGSVPDPRGPVGVFIDLISGATGIPQRILLGSEAGELASSQDTRNFFDKIASRQLKVAEPQILRPIVNRLIWAGILPTPSDGRFSVVWPSLYVAPPEDQVQIASTAADALNKIGAAVDPRVFVATFLPMLNPDSVLEAGVPLPGGINANRYP